MNAPFVPIDAEDVLIALRKLLGDDGAVTDDDRDGVAMLLAAISLKTPPPRPCAACGMSIWFLRTRARKLMPIDSSGRAHFASCTNPERFRKRD